MDQRGYGKMTISRDEFNQVMTLKGEEREAFWRQLQARAAKQPAAPAATPAAGKGDGPAKPATTTPAR